MPKPDFIELTDGTRIPILYEDRTVIAIDKPAGWMLVPFSWQKTRWNLHAAIVSSITAGAFWARSRGLKFLCHVHRLDAETTGVLLLARSRGALESLGEMFESRRMSKRYLAVVTGVPPDGQWICRRKLGPDPGKTGKVRLDEKTGRPAETHFRLLKSFAGRSLIEARPITGRTHQIRVHLQAAGLPILGDELYGGADVGTGTAPSITPRAKRLPASLALRAIQLAYRDPFTQRPVDIRAPFDRFVHEHAFDPSLVPA